MRKYVPTVHQVLESGKYSYGRIDSANRYNKFAITTPNETKDFAGAFATFVIENKILWFIEFLILNIMTKDEENKEPEKVCFHLPNAKSVDSSIEDLVEGNYATVTPHTRIQLLRNIFNDAKVVLVIENDELKGLLTKIDLIDFIADQPLSKA